MLVPVETAPGGKRETLKSYIVGHSETGHNHVLESAKGFDLIVDGDEVFFVITNPTSLVHKKQVDRHKDLKISKGIYKRFHDTEYNPFTRLIESVKD
jgi:hypothetical protein